MVIFAFTVLLARADGFVSQYSLDSAKVERGPAFRTAEQEASKRTRPRKQYSLHDQLVRPVFLLVFMGVTGLTIKRARYQYRKVILISSVAILGPFLSGSLSPFSAIQNALVKWQIGYLFLFLAVLISALLVGRAFCGYVCSFGAVQELLHLRALSRTISASWVATLPKLNVFCWDIWW